MVPKQRGKRTLSCRVPIGSVRKLVNQRADSGANDGVPSHPRQENHRGVREPQEPPVVRLTPNGDRIREAIIFLVGEGDKRKIVLTQYMILKTLFLADKAHLNRYGRPITFDNYAAMKDGPVPSLAYSVLKEEVTALSQIGLKRPAWKKKPAPAISERAFSFSNAAREYDKDLLSETDIEILSEWLTVVASLSFSQIRKLTHGDPAYVAAWKEDEAKRGFDMSYGMLFEVPDFERAQDLAFISKHM